MRYEYLTIEGNVHTGVAAINGCEKESIDTIPLPLDDLAERTMLNGVHKHKDLYGSWGTYMLNRLGMDGWRLVAVTPHRRDIDGVVVDPEEADHTFYFVRERAG